MSTASAPTPAVQPEPQSQVSRIVNSFIAPTKAFTGLERNASWWIAWLLISILAMAFVYTIDKKVGMDEITRIEMMKNSRQAAQFEQMTPEQQARSLRVSATIARYLAYATPVSSLIAFIVMAAVLMGTFNFGFGARVRFGVALAIVIYGSLPGLIKTLLATGSLLAGVNPEGFDIRNPVTSNPAMLVDPMQHKALYTLLTTFDVFSLWMVALIGIGFAIQGKLKRTTAISMVFGWYLLFKVLSAGLTALS
jgi:hypothetical protein